jgi:hypothetical protein
MNVRAPIFRLMAAAALAGIRAGCLHAAVPDTEAILGTDALECGDIHVEEVNLQADGTEPGSDFTLSCTQTRIGIDYAPAPEDFVSQPVDRVEECTAASLTTRLDIDSAFSPLAVVGGYRGFTDFRSVWLDEYYRQLFSSVPGYAAVSPHGWNALAGGRWTYVPGSAFLQGTVLRQNDNVSPGYEPQIGLPLLRGLDRLRTVEVRVSTENVVSPTVRTLIEAAATNTTGRVTRYSVRGSANWAATENLTLRSTVSGVREGDGFNAESASVALERDWHARWFLGLAARGYSDSGEIVDPLIVSSAAPALRTLDVAASLRRQGLRSAFSLEAGPYRTRYDPVPLGSSQFARLYESRNWGHVEGTASWRF